MIAPAMRQACITDLLRYSRSRGLWLLLLVVPVGARFLVLGSSIHIAVGGHLPVMTSATIGATLGIVVSTMLLPIGFIYLRSNVTRRQAWQIEEVTAARPIALVLGRFAADALMFLGLLSVGTLAGWFLAWRDGIGPLELGQLTAALWLVAAPALLGLAAVRQLLDALPPMRRAWGDLLAFILWITSLAMPLAVADQPSGLATNMHDFAGYTRPIIGEAALRGHEFSVGAGPVSPGRVMLDTKSGVQASGYIASRISWAILAVVMAILAGLLYRPHSASYKVGHRARRSVHTSIEPTTSINAASPAPRSRMPFLGLVKAEFLLIGRGRTFAVLAVTAAAAGLLGDVRHIGSPAGLLLLVFCLSGQAGWSEARQLLTLTLIAPISPLVRRGAFVIAGVSWSALMSLPAALVGLSFAPVLLGVATGGGASLVAMLLAAVSRSAFAPRMVLLVLWYGYFST
jgi:hypothetical protein